MRWLASLSILSLLLVSGCSSDEKKQDPPPATTKPKADPPRKAPEAKKAPEIKAAEEEPVDSTPIVIKGPRHPATSTDASSVETTKPNQAKIDELAAKARASQGGNNGDVYRESTALPPGRRKDLRSSIESIDKQVKDLSAERATLMEKHRTRKMGEKETATDPERVAAIDAQIADLQKQKQALVAELVELDKTDPLPPPAGTTPGSTPPAGSTPPPGDAPPPPPGTAPK